MFGGGDRPISSRREPEEPKETVFLCTDTLLMLGARFTLENRDFGKGVTTEHLRRFSRAAARDYRGITPSPGTRRAPGTWLVKVVCGASDRRRAVACEWDAWVPARSLSGPHATRELESSAEVRGSGCTQGCLSVCCLSV